MNWDRRFIRPVLTCAGENPAVFLEILARKAEDHPEAIPLFGEAMEAMGAWYQAQAAGLRAVSELHRVTEKK